MGEIQDSLFPLEFNKSVRVGQEKGTSLTIDPGAVLLREIGERLGLWRLLDQALVDGRNPALITHPWVELLRTAVLLAAQGWSSQREVDLLRHDPAFRLAVSERRGQRALQPRRVALEPEGLASQPTVSRLLSSLSAPWNRDALTQVLCSWAAQRKGLSAARPCAEVTIDLDSLPAEVQGEQPGSAYNGHYGCRCFHPLLVSWEFGDFLGARLRPGNVHTSDEAWDFVLPFLGWDVNRYACLCRDRARAVAAAVAEGIGKPGLSLHGAPEEQRPAGTPGGPVPGPYPAAAVAEGAVAHRRARVSRRIVESRPESGAGLR